MNRERASALRHALGSFSARCAARPNIIRAREGHKGTFAATTRRRPSGNLRCGNRLWLTRQRKTPAKRQSMTRGGLFAGTKCPYSASRVKSWTYLWVADAKPSATQYHPGGVVLITQPPRWLTTDLVCSYFGRESTQSQSSKGARAHVMRSGASLRGVQARSGSSSAREEGDGDRRFDQPSQGAQK